jgi:hypothetical protein
MAPRTTALDIDCNDAGLDNDISTTADGDRRLRHKPSQLVDEAFPRW